MGFSTWNTFAGDINEDLIREAADAMVQNGMKDAGYKYINIDDGWLLKERDSNGNVIVDQSKFPSGMSTLTNYIHSLGLNVGIYSSNGQYTCQGLAGGEGFELNDAKFYNDNGFDYLKYDFCYNELSGRVAYGPNIGNLYFENINYPPSSAVLSGIARLSGASIDNIGNNSGEALFTIQSTKDQTAEILINYATENARQLRFDVNGNQTYTINITDFTSNWDCSEGKNASVNISVVKGTNTIRFYLPITEQTSAHYSYKQMTDALYQQSRSFVLSICEWGSNQPWFWAQDDGNLWRTTGDISASWSSMLSIYEQNVVLDMHAYQNAYNDPDMMTAGMDGISQLQSQTQMTLWCQMMAPLIVGVDIRNMTQQTKDILLNKDLIAIDQDQLNIQGKRISSQDNLDILVKPLYDGSVSIVYFNKDNKNQKNASYILHEISNYIQIQNQLDWTMALSYDCTDLWSKEKFTVKSELLISNIQPNEAKIYRCYPNDQ